jgi:hypothetical protein
MKQLLKSLIRPALLPMISAVFISYIILKAIVPLMGCFEIFYQNQVLARPSYMLKFNTRTEKKTIFILGGSRHREMAFSDDHVQEQLRKKVKTNIRYLNLATPELSSIEQMALLQQSYFKAGSIVFIGVYPDIFATSKAQVMDSLDNQRLSFLSYKKVASSLRKEGIKTNYLYYVPLYKSLFWIEKFLASFNWRSLFYENWHRPVSFPRRPDLFGRNMSTLPSGLPSAQEKNAAFKKNHIYNRKLFQKIITIAQQKKYRVYLFELPISFVLQNDEAPIMKIFHHDLTYLANKTGAGVIFSDNTIFKVTDFYDPRHLNELGREKYEPVFLEQMAFALSN